MKKICWAYEVLSTAYETQYWRCRQTDSIEAPSCRAARRPRRLSWHTNHSLIHPHRIASHHTALRVLATVFTSIIKQQIHVIRISLCISYLHILPLFFWHRRLTLPDDRDGGKHPHKIYQSFDRRPNSYNYLRHFAHPPLNFTGGQKLQKFLARFSTPVGFDGLWFRNEST